LNRAIADTNVPSMSVSSAPGDAFVPYDKWLARADDLSREYASAQPFPAIVMDDFLTAEAAETALTHFPGLEQPGWINYIRPNERKFGMRDPSTIPTPLQHILSELTSPRFVELVAAITRIPGLQVDDSYEGAGLHSCDRGGFLNIHSDFNIHPHRPTWRRRLNLLIYLNPDWQEPWGGHLEFWDPGMKRCARRIEPIFNRAALFQTDETTLHGHPDPFLCPPHATRKALVLYYFTVEAVPPPIRSTNHRPRPTDGFGRRALINADKMALRVYDYSKRVLGFDDHWMSWFLGKLSRRPPGKTQGQKSQR
jgi:hypothetical protein